MIVGLIATATLSIMSLNTAPKKAILDEPTEKTYTQYCASCHGAGLNAPVLPIYPKLAGQYPDYLFYTLKSYKVGSGNPQYGRNNAIMGALVQGYSDADMKDIAAYIASLPGNFVIRK